MVAEENRRAALGRDLEPSPEEMELARTLRQQFGIDSMGTMQRIWRLDVYRTRRVLIALLDQLSDEEHDTLHRRFGER